MAEKKYRECAGAVIFDRKGRLLVGERKDKPGAWQFPQGGLDSGETPVQAAWREMHEEVGITESQVVLVETIEESMTYDVNGGWLAKEGFAGQRMFWTLFLLKDDVDNPADVCNLETGVNGEPAEFTSVKFSSWDEVIGGIVQFKRACYERLAHLATPIMQANVRSTL
ncbi:hypothetical protein CYMTET_7760 [Cymbomonas tetramitiformis]|uniref:Nudix hydrolase domain-containing protein n=1 Tax=Cymbomonas tetramitiformis TaxID=36881 RepID=A0AAE0GV08_9CHLO|nr:hypothetical protein CYMTET_7760 [Cymbomonas tetramitiformis]|eukprot:gene6311-7563_t